VNAECDLCGAYECDCCRVCAWPESFCVCEAPDFPTGDQQDPTLYTAAELGLDPEEDERRRWPDA